MEVKFWKAISRLQESDSAHGQTVPTQPSHPRQLSSSKPHFVGTRNSVEERYTLQSLGGVWRGRRTGKKRQARKMVRKNGSDKDNATDGNGRGPPLAGHAFQPDTVRLMCLLLPLHVSSAQNRPQSVPPLESHNPMLKGFSFSMLNKLSKFRDFRTGHGEICHPHG